MRIATLLVAIAVGAIEPRPMRPSSYAFALLASGRIVKLNVSTGRVVATGLTARIAEHGDDHGQTLAVDGGRVNALVPTRPQTLVSLDRQLNTRARTTLAADVDYRGVVRAGGATYAYGIRPGPAVAQDVPSEAAVVTRVGGGGHSWIIRPATYDWLPFSAATSSDGERLALTYHGMSTSGADLLDVGTGEPKPPCSGGQMPSLGCSPEVHGAIAAYGDGWVATTGSETLLVLNARGDVVRTIDSGFRHEHLMSLVVDRATNVAYSLATCFYGREGLRRASLTNGSSRRIRRAPCGNDLTVGPSRTLLAVESSHANAGMSVIALSRSTGRVIRRWRFGAPVIGVAAG